MKTHVLLTLFNYKYCYRGIGISKYQAKPVSRSEVDWFTQHDFLGGSWPRAPSISNTPTNRYIIYLGLLKWSQLFS